MQQTHLRNNCFNSKSDIDRKTCARQEELGASLIRKEKKSCNSNLEIRSVTNNKQF